MNISENMKELIISGIKKVQDVFSKELRASERILVISGDREVIEEEDFRITAIQVVENLTSLTYPFFDQQMQDYYSKNIIFLEGWYYEIIKEFKEDDYFLKVYDNAPERADKGTQTKSDIILALQIRKSKQMFNQLNLFIQRNNLLSDVENNEVKKHE